MQPEKIRLTCKLTTPQLRKRRATVIHQLKQLLLSKKEIENGYAYTFPGSDVILDTILDFIKSERLCCEFFSFRLAIVEETATLDIFGPAGSREFLDHEVRL